MENNPQEILALGQTIKHFRSERKISQEQLGFLSNIDRTYISGLERGIRNPSFIVLYRLLKSLNITPVEFFSKFEESFETVAQRSNIRGD